MLSQVSQLLEISGHYAEASQALALIEKAYQANPDESLGKQAAAQAKTVAAGPRDRSASGCRGCAGRRLAVGLEPVPGQSHPDRLLGHLCGRCLQEIPHMQRNDQAYRDKGFEVVGVNLDDDPGQ